MRITVKSNEFIPSRGTNEAAGYDLYADIENELEIRPHETVKVGTGVCIELEKGKCGLIFARSGIATKQGLRPANAVGLIDSDYRGELIVALHNDTNINQKICPKQRIAQLVIVDCYTPPLEVVDSLSDTTRGDGGFGSTGVC